MEKNRTCAEIAAEYVEWRRCYGTSLSDHWVNAFIKCSDFPGPKKTKQVWQWRYRYLIDPDSKDLFKWGKHTDKWDLAWSLMSESEAKDHFGDKKKYEKHAGPFEVEE